MAKKKPAEGLQSKAPKRPAKLMSVRDCATEIGYRYKHLRNLIDRDKVPYYKVDSSIRLDPAEVLAHLGKNRVEPITAEAPPAAPDETAKT